MTKGVRKKMGLDNGFIAKGIKREDIPNFVRPPFDDYGDEDRGIELAYWRKCWGLRGAILDTLHGKDGGYTVVDAEDFPALIQAIKPFFSKEYWDECGDSIWDFYEYFEIGLLQQIINLMWLGDYMKTHPEVTCYFYDSY